MRADRSEQGFTLIELLVSVGIVGILSAIAVPQYQGYRSGAFDAAAELTLRTVATAEEAYFVDYSKYLTCNHTTCPLMLPDIERTPTGITLQISATPSGFTGTATHSKGSGEIFIW